MRLDRQQTILIYDRTITIGLEGYFQIMIFYRLKIEKQYLIQTLYGKQSP